MAGLSSSDEADTVNALVPKLRAQGIEAIVVLVHQGGFQSGAGNCERHQRLPRRPEERRRHATATSRKIVARLDDAVDLVISGHTHAAYNCSANTVDVTGTTPATRQHAAPDRPAEQGRPAGAGDQRERLRPRADRHRPDASTRVARNVLAVSPTNRLVDRTDADSQRRGSRPNPEVKTVVAAYKTAVSPLANQVHRLDHRADAATRPMPRARCQPAT